MQGKYFFRSGGGGGPGKGRDTKKILFLWQFSEALSLNVPLSGRATKKNNFFCGFPYVIRTFSPFLSAHHPDFALCEPLWTEDTHWLLHSSTADNIYLVQSETKTPLQVLRKIGWLCRAPSYKIQFNSKLILWGGALCN